MAEPGFTVDIEETNAPVEAGETLTVTVSVENHGEEASETVTLLDFEDEEVASEDVELEPETSETIELEWTPDGDDVGDGQLTVQSEIDSESVAVTVEDAPAEFEVDVLRTNEYAPKGGTVSLTAEITNTGTLSGTQDVTITVNDEEFDTRTGLTLDGGESETIDVEYETEGMDIKDVSIEVATDDDSASETVPLVMVSVTPGRGTPKSKGRMGIIGWVVFLGMIIVLIPLIPFYIALKIIEKLTGGDESAA